jgi:hypothetical protein
MRKGGLPTLAGPDQGHGRVELQTFQNLVVNQSRNHVLHYSIEFLFYNSSRRFSSIIEGVLSNVTFSYSFAMERTAENPGDHSQADKEELHAEEDADGPYPGQGELALK